MIGNIPKIFINKTLSLLHCCLFIHFTYFSLHFLSSPLSLIFFLSLFLFLLLFFTCHLPSFFFPPFLFLFSFLVLVLLIFTCFLFSSILSLIAFSFFLHLLSVVLPTIFVILIFLHYFLLLAPIISSLLLWQLLSTKTKYVRHSSYHRWKSTKWAQRYANLWNNLGFSLYTVPSVCYIVAISDKREKSKLGVSADLVCHHWILGIKFNKNYLYWLSD